MSVFYCEWHGRLEDEDEVGFNEYGDGAICDEGWEELEDDGWGEEDGWDDDAWEDEDEGDLW